MENYRKLSSNTLLICFTASGQNAVGISNYFGDLEKVSVLRLTLTASDLKKTRNVSVSNNLSRK